MTKPRNNAPTTRGRPFQPGNPGRPKGSRHKSTLAAMALLDGEAEAITRKAVELAKKGDGLALRLCLERLVPPRKERPISIQVPETVTPADHPEILARVFSAVASGELLPTEGEAVARVLAEQRKAVDTAEIAERLAAIERKVGLS